MLGTGMRLTLMFQRKGSLYLAVGGDKAEATRATTSPQCLGQSEGPSAPNLSRERDRSSPSVTVSLVNMLIHEVSGDGYARSWGHGVGDPDIHGFTPLCRSGSCLVGRRCPGEDESGDRRGLETAWGSHQSHGAGVGEGGSQPGVPQAAATLALPFNPPQTTQTGRCSRLRNLHLG